MKILLDTCIWGGAVGSLKAGGHDVIWAGGWEEDPGDEEILTIAHAERRVLVTLDKDFGELAIVGRFPQSGILRIVGFPARRQAEVIQAMLRAHGAELEAGAIITVDPGRIRVRPPEADEPES